jgi:spermidine synthase
MRPIETLARERTPDGEELTLTRRDGVYYLNLAGSTLMSSRAHRSELDLASLACAGLAAATGHPQPRVLIGGLGFGYTLRAALDSLPPGSAVIVCEVSAMVLAANRSEVGALADRPLDDPRATAVHGDVWDSLGKAPFDAILLDADNGPAAFTLRRNERLYSAAGLARIARSLSPGGVLAVWSETPDPAFERRLAAAGFAVRAQRARAGDTGGGARYTIFLARRG